MRTVLQHVGVILFVGVVVFAPFFELIDEGKDLEEGADLVQTILFALTWGALAALLTKLFAHFLCWLEFSKVLPDSVRRIPERSRPVEIAPPELSLTFCSFRI